MAPILSIAPIRSITPIRSIAPTLSQELEEITGSNEEARRGERKRSNEEAIRGAMKRSNDDEVRAGAGALLPTTGRVFVPVEDKEKSIIMYLLT